MIPEFPAEAGEQHAVEFQKDGQTYRLQRVDGDTLVISRAGATREEFELVISHISTDGEMFDVDGHGQVGGVMGLGADRGMLQRLF